MYLVMIRTVNIIRQIILYNYFLLAFTEAKPHSLSYIKWLQEASIKKLSLLKLFSSYTGRGIALF